MILQNKIEILCILKRKLLETYKQLTVQFNYNFKSRKESIDKSPPGGSSQNGALVEEIDHNLKSQTEKC